MLTDITPNSPVLLRIDPDWIQKDITAYESAMLITLVGKFDSAAVLGSNVLYRTVTKSWPPEVLRHVDFVLKFRSS